MIVNQMNISNEELREQLSSQILEGTNQTGQNVAQELSNQYRAEMNVLKDKFYNRLDDLKTELRSEIFSKMDEDTNALHEKNLTVYNQKMDRLKTEFHEEMDSQLNQMMSVTKSLADSIADLQKDTAIIMKTLQLILTNMMLNKISDCTTCRRQEGTSPAEENK